MVADSLRALATVADPVDVDNLDGCMVADFVYDLWLEVKPLLQPVMSVIFHGNPPVVSTRFPGCLQGSEKTPEDFLT